MDVQGERRSGDVAIRLVRARDARKLQDELAANRSWLRPWEATHPDGMIQTDVRMSIRRLKQQYRDGLAVPLVMLRRGELCGQLNVWGIARGSLSSATIGYWISERFAGHGITPTCVALAIDLCFEELGLHRMEICMRPENAASRRVVEKLGLRHEGFRERYIHIDGAWRDHVAYAVTREEVPDGVLRRYLDRTPSHTGDPS